MPSIEYRVVQEQTSVDFEAAVNVALQDGWQPYGNLLTQVWEYDGETGRVVEWWYVQAMIRPVPPIPGPGPDPGPVLPIPGPAPIPA